MLGLLVVVVVMTMMAQGQSALLTLDHEPDDNNTCPSVCICNRVLTTVNCNGKRLTTIPTHLPQQVESLWLDHNQITALDEGVLVNLTNLKSVYLRNNPLRQIHPLAFQNLPQLMELYLTNGYIEQLTPDVFQGADSLTYLSLGANHLTSMPELRRLTRMRTLDLNANPIENATVPTSYGAMADLNKLVLSLNKITRLTADSFTQLAGTTLRALEITRNQIVEISPNAMQPLRSLQSLKIGYNDIDGEQLQNLLHGMQNFTNLESLDIRQIKLNGDIPSSTFSLLAASPLKVLIFKNNKIHNIPDQAFANLPKLSQLDLSACQIQEVSGSAFEGLLALQTLFLGDNQQITAVPQNLPASLQKLYLQGNNIQQLGAQGFAQLTSLRELYLSSNNLHQVASDSFLGLSNLRILHMNDNKLSYFPKDFFSPLTALETLVLKNNNMKTFDKSQGTFDGLQTLTTLDLSSNQCSYMGFRDLTGLESLQFLYLQNNNLKAVFANDNFGLFLSNQRKLQRLVLSNNSLDVIGDLAFRNLFQLQKLDLSNNHLSSWGPGLFSTPSRNLQELDLSNNQIALVNQTSLSDLQLLKMLNLSLNPFACTCDLLWFRSWLDNTTVNVTRWQRYRCASPPEWNGKLLVSFTAAKISCENYMWYYVGGACAGVFIITSVIFVVIYRKRWFLMFRFHRFKKAIRRACRGHDARPDGYHEIPGEDKQYDFFLFYSKDDTKWVCENILPQLDNGPKQEAPGERYPGQYSLYFDERDATPGKSVVANISDNLEASRAAVVILTRNLIGDPLCNPVLDIIISEKWEGHITSITVVKVGRLNPEHIPERLQAAMDRHDFIEWYSPATGQQDFLEQVNEHLANSLQQAQDNIQVRGENLQVNEDNLQV